MPHRTPNFNIGYQLSRSRQAGTYLRRNEETYLRHLHVARGTIVFRAGMNRYL